MGTDVPDSYGNVRATSGDALQLPCHVPPSADTNVTWRQTEKVEIGQPLVYDIYVNGQIRESLRRRYSIYDATAGDYSLKILKVRDVDIGRYRCFNNEQLIKNYHIHVTGEY